ncbi:MAG: hypothetical protein ACLT9P_06945 [Evtepia gabavorous]
MRILVVEDEADLNLLLCKVLTKAGYTVDGCLDGEDAQAHLLGAAYDGISAGCDAAQKGRIHPGAGTAGPGERHPGTLSHRPGQCGRPGQGAGPGRGRLSGQTL